MTCPIISIPDLDVIFFSLSPATPPPFHAYLMHKGGEKERGEKERGENDGKSKCGSDKVRGKTRRRLCYSYTKANTAFAACMLRSLLLE